MFQTKFVEEFKTHVLCSVSFSFFKICSVCEIMCKKYGTARQAKVDNIIQRREQAICTPDNEAKNTDTHNI